MFVLAKILPSVPDDLSRISLIIGDCKMKIYTLCASVLFGIISHANAATVYNEAISGDLTDFLSSISSTDIGLLGTGPNTILGSLDGGPAIPDDPPGAIAENGPDEFDVFLFSTTGPWTVDFVSTSGLTSAGIIYYENDGGITFGSFVSASSVALDVFGGPLAAGSYALALLPPGNTGALGYDITINVSEIPIPAAVWLFGSGLLGLIGMARRKKTA